MFIAQEKHFVRRFQEIQPCLQYHLNTASGESIDSFMHAGKLDSKSFGEFRSMRLGKRQLLFQCRKLRRGDVSHICIGVVLLQLLVNALSFLRLLPVLVQGGEFELSHGFAHRSGRLVG